MGYYAVISSQWQKKEGEKTYCETIGGRKLKSENTIWKILRWQVLFPISQNEETAKSFQIYKLKNPTSKCSWPT